MICPDCESEMRKSYLIENGEGRMCMWMCDCPVPYHLVHAARQRRPLDMEGIEPDGKGKIDVD
jgi:hypothetical protein